jgi:alpha-1,3-rhamnosyl/mannosyltransferase
MVTAVPLAADPVFTPADEKVVARVRQKYNLPPSYLLFVSSLEPRKNIDVLVDALVETKTDIPIVLVGWKGWGEKSWFEKIKNKNLKNRVYLTGHIPDHDLRAVYTGAQALIYPSLYEGFGLPLVEAMACGCPVICSNVSSMPEVAGDAAVLIDPMQSSELAQAIENVVHDTGLRNFLVEKGRQRALGFTWESTADQTLDVYRNVVK